MWVKIMAVRNAGKPEWMRLAGGYQAAEAGVCMLARMWKENGRKLAEKQDKKYNHAVSALRNVGGSGIL